MNQLPFPSFRRQPWRVAGLALLLAGFTASAQVPVRSVLEEGSLGLHPPQAFRLVEGTSKDPAVLPQALWFFQGDLVAVPTAHAAGFDRKFTAQEDVRHWAQAHESQGDGTLPQLVWVGSPQVVRGVRMAQDGRALVTPSGSAHPFALVPKIPSNQSYFDVSSLRHFEGRLLDMRGRQEGERFVARTLWPCDFALQQPLQLQPFSPGARLATLVRQEGGGAKAPLAARVLWQRDPRTPLVCAGKPVLAVLLNGAQGDDDEAHGGHFAIATGRFGAQGQWGDWLVNNFYGLDMVSEKGILAASLPMDAYMGDLNSGQAWYRPSAMVVAVLRQDRASARVQEALNRTLNHFYRHDFRYHHARANCAGISLETLRSLGWDIPRLGPTSRLKAIAALPVLTVKDLSLEKGRKAYDHLVAEQTDLFPMVAFEAAGHDLLDRLAQGKAATPFERMLAEDLEALLYVRIPQFPSSRSFGQAPVASLDEYLARTPKDMAQWKIIPLLPRPFPEEFKDADAPAEPALPSSYAVGAYGGVLGLAVVEIGRRWRRKRRR
jgi:hypothetical protein